MDPLYPFPRFLFKCKNDHVADRSKNDHCFVCGAHGEWFDCLEVYRTIPNHKEKTNGLRPA